MTVVQSPGFKDNSVNKDVLARSGSAHLLVGRYQEAFSCFDSLVNLGPLPWSLAHRGEALMRLGRLEEALQDFDRATEIQEDYAWAWSHKGLCYRMALRYDEALVAFSRSLLIRPMDPWTLIHRGNMLISFRRFEEALRDMDLALSLKPNVIPHALGERALLLNGMGRFEASIQDCEKALAADEQDFVALYSLSVARFKLYGTEVEREFLAESLARLRAYPNAETNPMVAYRIAGLLALLGEKQAALQLLGRLVGSDVEAYEVRRHDPAWDDLREDTAFLSLSREAVP